MSGYVLRYLAQKAIAGFQFFGNFSFPFIKLSNGWKYFLCYSSSLKIPWYISQLGSKRILWTTSRFNQLCKFDSANWSNITFIAIFQFLPSSCNMRNEKVHSMKLKLFFLSSSKLNSIWVKISDFCAKVENQHIYNMSPNIL